MKPAPFNYHRPETLEDAVSVLAKNGGNATVLAGGQSLIPMMNTRLAGPETLVDINGVSELDHIREDEGVLAIGALTRQATVERSSVAAEQCPLLVEALEHVGHEAIRHRGTVGGNLAHSDPTSELPAVARVLGAEFVIQGGGGERTVPAEEFFQGFMTTAVGPDELLTEVRFPIQSDGEGWSFQETAPRKGDYAVVGVATTLGVDDDGTCTSAGLVYTAVGDGPVRVPEAEERVVGAPADGETFAAAGDVAREHIDPPSDLHGSSGYRKNLIATLTQRALATAAERVNGNDGAD